MKILGLNKTTLLDYPQHVAATIFVGGCNFRCPFCHNGHLVLSGSEDELSYSKEEILSFLVKRKNVLKGVCITGGEPTLYPQDLTELIQRIKALGYLVKLDTNGSNPQLIRDLYENKLIDYVAMDIKASPSKYAMVCGFDNPATFEQTMERIRESVRFLTEQKNRADFDYEFRTTVVAPFFEPSDFLEIGDFIQGAKAYYLQSFQENENVLSLITQKNQPLGAYSHEQLESFLHMVKPFVSSASLRGID